MIKILRPFARLTSRVGPTSNLPFHLLCLVLGFFFGNLFGTFLSALRQYVASDILIILCVCLLFEWVSAQAYQGLAASDKDRKPPRWRPRPVLGSAVHRDGLRRASEGGLRRRSLNLLKIGALFGFFVDAFKVGS